MFPILGRYGSNFLYSYTVVWGIGICLCLAAARWLSPPPKERHIWLDPALAAGIAGMIGGRLLFVWLNRIYFKAEAGEWWQLQLGGLAYHGVVAAGLPAFVWLARRRGDWSEAATIITPILFLAHGVGWFACYWEGCGYGAPSSIGWHSGELPDAFGVFELRYQTQLLSAAIFAALFGWGLWASRQQNLAKATFWLGWMMVAALNAGIDLLRGDLKFTVWDYPAALWVDVGLLALFFALFCRQWTIVWKG